MPTLLDKIKASAEGRLQTPPNRTPSQELDRFKRFLKVETQRLKFQHRTGEDGLVICQARAKVLDLVIEYLIKSVLGCSSLIDAGKLPPLAMVAIGGYGRRELNLHSDIDIMFLHDGDVSPGGKHRNGMQALTEAVLYALYDLGFKVGHSVRNIADCVKEANSNMQSKTSLIEARIIWGDEALFNRMISVVVAKCVDGFEDDYIQARLKDQSERRGKYGDSFCMLEPNIKNGCGGLRDYQNLLWMAFFKYRIRSLEELEKMDMISETELKQLAAGYRFLLRVRNDLHYHVNRSMDMLLKGVQPSIANNLGYSDRSPIKRIERFMRVLYMHMRNIYLITRTLEQRLAFREKSRFLPMLKQWFRRPGSRRDEQKVDGFQFIDGEIIPISSRVFKDQPRRLMRVFLYAQQRRLKLHPDLAQMIRNHLSLADKSFLTDPGVHQTFLEILNHRGNVGSVLRTMHETGILGRYMPEFGKMTCLVQHEFFHRYTADEHTLVCLEMLDEVWAGAKAPYKRYTGLLQKIEHPNLLNLALLLHDSGKAVPSRKHANESVRLCQRAIRRLGLDAQAAQTLVILVENHLALIQISQQRDLEDPGVAKRFASLMKTPENLDLLLLHTFVDSMGTSAHIWNDFKEALVWTLYDQTMAALIGGAKNVKAVEKHRESLIQEVRQLMPKDFSEEELQDHFKLLPPRYYQVHSAAEILADLVLAHDFYQLQLAEGGHALEPVIRWTNAPDRGYCAIRICTWDRAGLFSKIAGSLTSASLNILSAQIFSRKDGVIFDTFYVTDAQGAALPSRKERDAFESMLKDCLTGRADINAVMARQQPSRAQFAYLEGEKIPVAIQFENSISEFHTVIDIQSEDRFGLLFAISKTLNDLKLDIAAAKINTEKGAAVDSFYVNEAGGPKVVKAERIKLIENRLRAVISKLL